MTSTSKGFSLIETIVVVSILLVLSGILFPVMVRARVAAYETLDRSNMRQVLQSCLLYTIDYDDRWPLAVSPVTIQRLDEGVVLFGEPTDTAVEELPYLGDILITYTRSHEVLCSPFGPQNHSDLSCKVLSTDYWYNDLAVIMSGSFRSRRPALMSPVVVGEPIYGKVDCGWSDSSVRKTTRINCLNGYYDPVVNPSEEFYWND